MPHSTWPWPVTQMLGEMAAAGVLMQSNIKFNGALVMQIFGEGPVKVAVAEVQQDLSLRVTAKVVGEVAADAHLQDLVNVNGRGRCAITLDPKDRLPGPAGLPGRGAAEREPRRRPGRTWPTCWSTTCGSPSSSIRGWCWRPTTPSRRAC